MHDSAIEKMKAFFNIYLSYYNSISILINKIRK